MTYLKYLTLLIANLQNEIKKIFESLSYKEFINIRRLSKYFNLIDKYDLFNELQTKQVEIEDEIENIQGLMEQNALMKM